MFCKRDLTGDVVVITGAGMGIGRQMALQFAQAGCKIAIWDFNAEAGLAVKAEIEAAGGEAEFYEADVTDREKVYALAKQVEEHFGHIDILVNNAGYVGGRPIGAWDDDMILRTMNVNLIAHFWTIKAVLDGMIARNKGYIVEIASAAGTFGAGGMAEYSSSKAGVIGLAMSLRSELKGKKITGVRTLLVCPSYINTGMFNGAKPPLLTSWLTPEYAAHKIVKSVQKNKHDLIMPRICRLLRFSQGAFPDFITQWVLGFIGAFNSMDEFKGTREYFEVKDVKRVEAGEEQVTEVVTEEQAEVVTTEVKA